MKALLLLCLLDASTIVRAEDHPAPAALLQESLYALDGTWTNQAGQKVAWSAGTTRVVALGYATCKGLCPRIIADMQRIEQGLEKNSKVRFTFVTLDPENDKQPQLQALAENHKLTAERWDILRGSEDDLLELAVALGVRYDRLPNGIDFAHSYLITVIGPDGKVLHKWTNQQQGPDEAIRALKGL